LLKKSSQPTLEPMLALFDVTPLGPVGARAVRGCEPRAGTAVPARRVQEGVRISLIGLPLAAICLTGLAAACSGPHRAGSAAPVPSPSGSASTGTFAAEGILAGHLYGVGGVAPGAPRPWPGTVILTGRGGHRVIRVGASGGYFAWVPDGVYTVAGRSPRYQGGAAACRAAGPVTVTSGHRTEADVLCQLK
jgi:hypothetical protein